MTGNLAARKFIAGNFDAGYFAARNSRRVKLSPRRYLAHLNLCRKFKKSPRNNILQINKEIGKQSISSQY